MSRRNERLYLRYDDPVTIIPESGITEDAWNAITDHYPVIGSWIDDSTWLECWCGWSQSDEKAVPGWWEHIEAALVARQTEAS